MEDTGNFCVGDLSLNHGKSWSNMAENQRYLQMMDAHEFSSMPRSSSPVGMNDH